MTAPYSVDLRERALARKGAGETNREIAVALRISPSCVSKWTKRKRETGSLAPAQIGRLQTPQALGRERRLAERAQRRGAVHTARLVGRIGERGIKTHPRAVWVFVHAEGLSFKKTLLAEEQTRPDVARKRARWKAHQGHMRPRSLCSSTRPG
jgi:transposase